MRKDSRLILLSPVDHMTTVCQIPVDQREITHTHLEHIYNRKQNSETTVLQRHPSAYKAMIGLSEHCLDAIMHHLSITHCCPLSSVLPFSLTSSALQLFSRTRREHNMWSILCMYVYNLWVVIVGRVYAN
jgi:hypothetical protein